MQLRIETEILGDFIIEKDMKIKHHPYEIDIKYDSEKREKYISIENTVHDYSTNLPRIELKNNKIETIIFPKEDFLNEQLEILKHIESFGAIDFGIEKINWDNCSIEWIPENEMEQMELSIRKYNRNLNYQLTPKKLTKKLFQDTIIHRKQLKHLDLPFSFYRAGINFYHNFQYQESFINFYLMLEGFFANNQFKNSKVKSEFKKSKILLKSIKQVFENLKISKNLHYEWLIKMCEKYNKPIDEYSIIHILVELRGNLSHYSIDKPNKHRNSFLDRDFQSLAFITMSICLYATNDLRLEPFRKQKLSC